MGFLWVSCVSKKHAPSGVPLGASAVAGRKPRRKGRLADGDFAGAAADASRCLEMGKVPLALQVGLGAGGWGEGRGWGEGLGLGDVGGAGGGGGGWGGGCGVGCGGWGWGLVDTRAVGWGGVGLGRVGVERLGRWRVGGGGGEVVGVWTSVAVC